MREIIKKLVYGVMPVADAIIFLFVFPAGLLMRFIRRVGVHRLPLSRKALHATKVFPVRDHYYEPRFNYNGLPPATNVERDLPGIDMNADEQLALLESFSYAAELEALFRNDSPGLRFRLKNYSFSSGDAEYWYQLIRSVKPRRIYEIGSGHSTLMAIEAVRQNHAENPDYACEHVCIEPYEMPWLEQTGVRIVRKKVEDVEMSFFHDLADNDILFIDSSHMIRPGGDVLYEYLQLLPRLKPGVIVHIHDIFTPCDYPDLWLRDEVRFWNEQYLLEAFLTENPNWKIIGAVNYLQRRHYEAFRRAAPSVKPGTVPASFYIQRIS